MNKKDFSIDGSLVIVTGGNSGIGLETARKLSDTGARVVIACRDMDKAEKTINDLGLLTHNPVKYLQLDLSDLNSIHTFSEKFLEIYGTPDVLVNNAAVYMRKYVKTSFGMEYTMAVNYMGPFYLSNLMLPHMARLDGETRIVNVTSDAYHVRDFKSPFSSSKHEKGFNAYSQSKRALMYFTFELAERIKKTAITVNCVNPGQASTNIWPADALYWKIAGKIISMFADPPSYAAENVVYTASSNELSGISGKYINNLAVVEPKEGAFKKDVSQKLWEDTLDYLQKLI